MFKLALSGLLCIALGCTHAQEDAKQTSERGSLSTPFQATGRVLVLRGPSASFGGDRVVGPSVDVARQPDGSWSGWIQGQAVSLTPTSPGEFTSPAVQIKVEELADGTEASGLWLGHGSQVNMISIHVTPQEFFLRSPPYTSHPVYLDAAAPAHYGTGASAGALELVGQAATVHPPEPQFVLALLGAF